MSGGKKKDVSEEGDKRVKGKIVTARKFFIIIMFWDDDGDGLCTRNMNNKITKHNLLKQMAVGTRSTNE